MNRQRYMITTNVDISSVFEIAFNRYIKKQSVITFIDDGQSCNPQKYVLEGVIDFNPKFEIKDVPEEGLYFPFSVEACYHVSEKDEYGTFLDNGIKGKKGKLSTEGTANIKPNKKIKENCPSSRPIDEYIIEITEITNNKIIISKPMY